MTSACCEAGQFSSVATQTRPLPISLIDADVSHARYSAFATNVTAFCRTIPSPASICLLMAHSDGSVILQLLLRQSPNPRRAYDVRARSSSREIPCCTHCTTDALLFLPSPGIPLGTLIGKVRYCPCSGLLDHIVARYVKSR